ncbi:ABC transporter permease [Granulicella sp. dw_53]|uniref:ABC transporter permease n=1 Tax=Granulicella sp. dw_53 TaxID=2719792 RepID=UPI001C49FA2F|nr:ABC transporter permease [Granulicella sp. dw_53]
MIKAHIRELSVALTILLLMIALALIAPGYFSRQNLADLFLANAPVMIIALGMTLIILTGQIDISVGSVFAICSVVAGLSSRLGAPTLISAATACLTGAACGALNGALVGYLRIPSIVVTLATMVALRDALRWQTQGSWIGNLPASFQWMGFTQATYTAITFSGVTVLVLLTAWSLRFLSVGRAVFATGSNPQAARIIGIDTNRVTFSVFTLTGALTGLAAMLNSVRFNQIPSNSGLGLEMKVIAAVAVGGAAITGGYAAILGTVLGVVLLGSIGTALTFLGVSAYWEKAIQGAIILGAITLNILGSHREKNAPIKALAR